MPILIALFTALCGLLVLNLDDRLHLVAAGLAFCLLTVAAVWWNRRQQAPDEEPGHPIDDEPDRPNRLRQIVLGVAGGMLTIGVAAGLTATAERITFVARLASSDCAALQHTLDTLQAGGAYEYGLGLIRAKLSEKTSPGCRQSLVESKARFLTGWAEQSTGPALLDRLNKALPAVRAAQIADLIKRIESGITAEEMREKAERINIAVPQKTVIQLPDFEFNVNDARLNADGSAAVRHLAIQLSTEFKGKPLRIEGHTDDTGDSQRNLELSQLRAESVRDALETAGVERSRMTTEGFGARRLLDMRSTQEARGRNRRVEVTVE